MFHERLRRARKAAGLSMNALGLEVGVSANAIKKYEHGLNMPTSANLLKLAKALGVRTEYFFRPVKLELEGVEYRKRSNTPKALLKKINGDVIEQAERWTELLDLYPDSVKPIEEFTLPVTLPNKIESEGCIERIANQVRKVWDLGLNPIHDMIDTLESKGIMVISTAVESKEKFDGLAGTVNGTPIIVISSHQPGDRQRFTLAHELGHLLLHSRLGEGMDEEKACNRFAGAFLLPNESIIQHLGRNRQHLELQEAFMLKHEFGISMMGVIFRALQSSIITEGQKLSLNKRFSSNGWRKQEPGKPYPQESTYLFKQLIYRALAEDYIGDSKAAELLGISLSQFHKDRKLG